MSQSPTELVISRLRGLNCNPQRSGDGWAAHCPGHEDSTASLSINTGADGRVLLYCHAGCPAKELLDRCGLEPRDLFVQDRTHRAITHRAAPRAGRDWAALSERFAAAVNPLLLDDLARGLGVDAAALVSLRIGWATQGDLAAICGKPIKSAAWVFPMMSGAGEIVGLNARPPAGRKWTVCGGHLGLFVPAGLDKLPDPVYLPEGASDTAAALSRGWAAVGRPSNKAGVSHLAELLRGRRVIVVGENDAKADGKWPGRDGARATAAQLAHAWGVAGVDWMLPPDGSKDLREWHRANPVGAGGGAHG